MSGLQKLHPDWEYVLWDDEKIKSLPSFHLLNDCKGYSSKSNVIRLDVVNLYGGVYCDVDVEGIKSLTPLLNVEAFAAEELPGRFCNAIFGAVAGHPWLKNQISELPNYVKQLPPWGPTLMSLSRERVTVYPTNYFYPFLWDEQPCKNAESYLIHHWTKTWGTAK